MSVGELAHAASYRGRSGERDHAHVFGLHQSLPDGRSSIDDEGLCSFLLRRCEGTVRRPQGLIDEEFQEILRAPRSSIVAQSFWRKIRPPANWRSELMLAPH
jgi:hypothetical protein